ncbi:MAG: alpha/beta hydrolase [Verrucomicrobia bacterium]|nr:alpha/beta hydrolase [Verrucomicrobiota bacterium]
MWLSGGGWRNCNKEGVELFLIRHGFALASINYRVSVKAIVPANILDCKAAVRWLRRHAKEYGLDPHRIGVWGSSAGGHLAALLGASNGRKELEGDVAKPVVSCDVQAVCDFCGPSDLTRIARPSIRRKFPLLYEVTAQNLGGPVEKRRDKALLVSPLHYVTSSCPPMLIVHGEEDDVVPVEESIILHEALKRAEADSTLYVLKGEGHGWKPGLTAGRVAAFFKRTLVI